MGTQCEVSFKISFKKNGIDTARENFLQETLLFDKSTTLEEMVNRIESHAKGICLKENWKLLKIREIIISINNEGDHS